MATIAFETFVETLRHDDTLSISPMRVADALSLPLQQLAANCRRSSQHRVFTSRVTETTALPARNAAGDVGSECLAIRFQSCTFLV
ncbi:hypothetical protein SAMN05216403_13325 [Nitrosospira multiformis ATCC 25196]|uniref:Uncharacterized protein n=1 Tax=Nitrosospira multiformis (strain ATCC 25196 / NCIMB 11849 / C 71) TaxID=323848 RepID=A0A1H5XNV7_NITMU|nr:hypothetical protein SAMN05216403_13325 [Nitrosospira multiformis ATCC 25196]